jgi:hypothetical protein
VAGADESGIAGISLDDGAGAGATCAVPLLEILTTRERDRLDDAPLESVAFT